MDVEFQKRFGIGDNNVLKQEPFIVEEPKLLLGNVNLYLDFNPNENIRGLIELGLNSSSRDKDEAMNGYLGTAEFEKTGDPAVDGLTALLEGAVNSTAGKSKVVNGLDSEKYGGINIERAWVDLLLNESVTLKAGKFITPAGIWNVDHGSPIITTVRQPNQTDFFPIFPIDQIGVMAYGQTYMGDHDLNWNAYLSTGRGADNNKIEDLNDYGFGGKFWFGFDVLDGVRLGSSMYTGTLKNSTTDFHINTKFSAQEAGELAAVYGQILATGGTPDEAQTAVQLKFQQMLGAKAGAPDLAEFSYPVTVTEKAHEGVVGAELKVESNGFTLQGEYNYRLISNDLKSEDQESSYNAFYGLVSYLLPISDNLSVSPYAMFEQITWSDPFNNVASRGLASVPLSGWNSSWFGLNLNVYNNYSLKVEYQYASILLEDQPNAKMGSYKEGDLDIQTFSTQISVAF